MRGTRWRATLAALLTAATTSGCVAAAVPIVAGGLVARRQIGGRGTDPAPDPANAARPQRSKPGAASSPPQTLPPPAPGDLGRMVPGQVYRGSLPAPDGTPAQASSPTTQPAPPPGPVPDPTPAVSGPAMPPPGMQYLYGSAEAAAISVQAWRTLVSYVAVQALTRPADSVVLSRAATLGSPAFAPCGDKPLAVVVDIDETVLLNLGFEADDAAHPGRRYDERRWQAWERTGAADVTDVPGARSALTSLRNLGVTVVFNSNRSAANAGETEHALVAAGLGPAKHGDTLFLQGDDDGGGRKDGRRARIAARYCVLAMAGDQLGDFSDLFNADLAPRARRRAALAPAVAHLFGAGWFVLPNPVYGTALKGGMDEVFPRDKRWSEGAP